MATFGRLPNFPPNPAAPRQFTNPSTAYVRVHARGGVGEPGGGGDPATGAAASVTGFAAGRRSATSRGQTVAASAAGNVNVDSGR